MMRVQSSFYHFRLIDWTDENKNFIHQLIRDIKGEHGSLLFEILAKEFLFRIRQFNTLEESWIIVPCPPTPDKFSLWDLLFEKNIHEKKDHSFYWAQQFNKKYPIHNLLSHPPYYSLQKDKDLQERIERRFITKSPLIPNQKYIFTDDIVTSGSTAKAAYLALGKPDHFMVWSIFWKRKNSLEIH